MRQNTLAKPLKSNSDPFGTNAGQLKRRLPPRASSARYSWYSSAFLLSFVLYIMVSLNSPQFAIQTKTLTKKILRAIPIHEWLSESQPEPITVTWGSYENGSSYAISESVSPTIAVKTPTTLLGTGLDLAIVLNTSLAMESKLEIEGISRTRLAWLQQAALNIIDNLPQNTTQVTLIAFNETATVLAKLNFLHQQQHRRDLVQAIHSLRSAGKSAIGNGIESAAVELSTNIDGFNRSRQIVLISDGFYFDNPTESLYWANFMRIRVHTVALKGLKRPGDINLFALVPEHGGEFVWNDDLEPLLTILQATAPHNNTIKTLDIALPNGTWLRDVKANKESVFILPPQYLKPGYNNFIAHAESSDGYKISKTLTLFGKTSP